MEYRTKSLFGDYAKELQAIVTNNIAKFKESFYPKYFAWGAKKIGLDYATVIGKERIEAMASIVAHGAESPLRSRAGLEKLYGEVAAIKLKRKMDEQEYRSWLSIRDLPVNDSSKLTQIVQLIWNDLSYCANACNSRLDWMALQALSTGTVPITTTTNPDGVVPGTIDMLVPSAHKAKTDSAFGTTADNQRWRSGNEATTTPISNIRYLVQKAWNDEGIELSRMLMTPSLWFLVQKSKEVTDTFDGIPSLENFNTFLQSQGLPTIELVITKVRVEKNGLLVTVNGWEDDKYVTFLPAGNAGIMHNAYAIEELMPVDSVSYANADRILLSKWAQTEPFGEYTRGETIAFPGLEVADQMYIIDTYDRS